MHMPTIAFADVVHQTIYFRTEVPSEALVLELIDTPWFQRLRDVGQTGNASLVYMFSAHSRFGHSIGVSYLANHLMDKLELGSAAKVKQYRNAISAAALLHDIGHIAPGSHAAYRTWWPDVPDCHEEITVKIVQQDPRIHSILQSYGAETGTLVSEILAESEKLPAWTWQVISGGGWNVDRGNWCIVDSVMSGVSYGRYNIPAIIESIVITPDDQLALHENRLDAMLHFAIARHSMYRQVYQHRVLLASEMLNAAIVQRARDLGSKLDFADKNMRAVLDSKSPHALGLDTIFAMRESWWKYHLSQWTNSSDPILSDLCLRLQDRRLLKTVRLQPGDDADAMRSDARRAVEAAGYDPRYYLHEIGRSYMHAGDSKQSMPVLLDDGTLRPLAECDPLWSALTTENHTTRRSWIVLPAEAKQILGRAR